MRAGSVVVVDVRGQDTAQIALVEDDDVIETFAADQTDDPLDVGVLPGRARCGNDLCDPHRLDTLASAVRCVMIAQQITRSRVPRERSLGAESLIATYTEDSAGDGRPVRERKPLRSFPRLSTTSRACAYRRSNHRPRNSSSGWDGSVAKRLK